MVKQISVTPTAPSTETALALVAEPDPIADTPARLPMSLQLPRSDLPMDDAFLLCATHVKSVIEFCLKHAIADAMNFCRGLNDERLGVYPDLAQLTIGRNPGWTHGFKLNAAQQALCDTEKWQGSFNITLFNLFDKLGYSGNQLDMWGGVVHAFQQFWMNGVSDMPSALSAYVRDGDILLAN